MPYLDCFIGVHDDGNYKTEYDVDEEADEREEVNFTEDVDDVVAVGHLAERGVHVVPVHQWEHTLHRDLKRAELSMGNTCIH